ncbi:uncharacterized protein LOC104420044 [Eucalyptus grandis]|uniref:Uncharacterized protein n=3 Tax=Eucalyptus TaxID=3932 RepID=A0ACC3JJS0_EUCGR|nr:uncharacterized protein LOC104420044 [Eucalyptus grandis]KAK3414346.1 hypothetical protein EUGRSUZ_I02808 [Eucalyptus grandis]
MGSEINLGGRSYDLAMSKRTRKPLKLEETISDISVTGFARSQGSEAFLDQEKGITVEELASDRQSLKQLINSEGKPPLESGEERRRSSLGHHFTEEAVTQLQVVRVRAKQRQGGAEGMKLKGMVSRCAKVLSQLIKGHPPPAGGSKKQLILRLTN